MKSASRALRTVLAAVLFAGPAAAQVRVAAVGESVAVSRVAAVPAALGASGVPSALTMLPAASLPAGAASAPSALAPAAAPAAIASYRAAQQDYAAVEKIISPFMGYRPGAISDEEYDRNLARMDAAVTQMKALEAAHPTIAYDAQGALSRAWSRLMGNAPALQAAAASGRAFDGAASKSGQTAAASPASSDEEAAIPEELPTDTAEAAPQMLELFVTRESKLGIKKGQLTSHVGLIKGKGSLWYWGKFQKGMTIALKSGTQTMFVTKVEGAKTLPIGQMQRKDFEGLLSAQRMSGKSVVQLRAALIQDLKDRQARRPGAPTPVSSQSEVRLVRFMSSVKARDLPENKDESAYPVAPRTQFELPAALQGLNHLLPKTVLLDMRLFPDGVPYPLIEDMTKLMKTGVYFVLMSDKPSAGPGSVEDLLTKKLGIKQRDQISRYKMVVLSDDGNNLSGYSGNFSKPLPSVRFTPAQLEILSFVASSQGAATVDAKSTRVEATFARGVDAEKARAAFFDGIKKMSLNPDQWQWSVSELDGKSVVTVRPQTLVSALPHLLQVMRDHEGLFINNSDIMVISRDAALRAALPGSVQPAAHLANDGEAFADESLASLLGPYRENKPGDLAASASKISSFIQNPNRGFGSFGNIYMMTGHIMHSAFNWAVWTYRNTGKFPTAEETVAVARDIWEHEAAAAGAKSLLGRPGESLAGFYETVEQRLRAMHQVAADVLKVYPIALGTELPNMVVLDRYKKGGELDHRDIFRLIFDFVVARKTADGKLDMAIVDFKTGQVPTLQSLEKDTQVQLYDLLVRRMWKQLPVPYGGTGVREDVTDYKLNFLYTAGAYQPNLNDWSRLKFDKFLKNVMNRIRNHNNPKPKKEAKAKKGDAAKGEKGGAPKAAAVKIDKSRPKTADAKSLEIPQTVPGLKIKKEFAQQIVAGTKKIEYRTVNTAPKGFVAIIQTFTDEEPGRPAEVVAFARISHVTQADGQYEWHLTNVTPVKPYIVPNNKPGAIIWVKDVPVQGPRRLKKDK
ncbi:MAG: PD-(D/E)XK nuclease family protein [Elusimicrobiota bacterium]